MSILRCWTDIVIAFSSAVAFGQEVSVDWLDHSAPAIEHGVTFGVPWPRGMLRRADSLSLGTVDGKAVPVQSRPLAFWPDGSLKWTGLAVSAGPGLAGPVKVSQGTPAGPRVPVRVTQNPDGIEVDTGAIKCHFRRDGASFLESVSEGGHDVARDGRLIALLEDRSQYESSRTIREEEFVSAVKSVTVEQSGPIRAVIRIQGFYKSGASGRSWLPFTVRLYFFAGQEALRMVRTFVFDGDEHKDFIKGLGIAFSVPLPEQMQNRHVRFSVEDSGVWGEPSFLRTGRADIFRMAEAMTRHTTEVDTYHQGRFAGLGSRHNVRHWGCGAKEVRPETMPERR